MGCHINYTITCYTVYILCDAYNAIYTEHFFNEMLMHYLVVLLKVSAMLASSCAVESEGKFRGSLKWWANWHVTSLSPE